MKNIKILAILFFIFFNKNQNNYLLIKEKEDYKIYSIIINYYLEKIPFKIDEIIIIKEVSSNFVLENFYSEFIDFIKETRSDDKEIIPINLKKCKEYISIINKKFDIGKNYKILTYNEAINYEKKFKNKNIMFLSFSHIVYDNKKAQAFLALQEGLAEGWELYFYYLIKSNMTWQIKKEKKIAFY